MPMSHRLREGLAYCRIDDEVIFLDIQSDRYFRLSARMKDAFTTFIDGGQNSEAEFSSLTRNNILTMAPRIDANDASLATLPLPLPLPLPTRSALEQPDPSGPFKFSMLLEIAILVLGTRRMLTNRRLADIMESLVCYRREHSRKPPSQTTTLSTRIICDAAHSFNRARLYVPVTTSCLLDSIAMTKFLSRRRIETNLVFGVTRAPFAAHCWVQIGDVVLNDTVGNVAAHTPIRIV